MHEMQEEYMKALELYEHALEIYKEAPGGRHPNLANTLANTLADSL